MLHEAETQTTVELYEQKYYSYVEINEYIETDLLSRLLKK